jgi:ATP-dependent Lon protease
MPRPLLDRMEVIEVNSYTANEKLAIAQQYLVPRQLGEAGLKKGDIRFGRKALKLMIDRYTREAGVRSLERTIGHVCRKAVTNHLMEAGAGAEFEQLKITEANLSDYLGREKYQKKCREDKPVVGIVTGLAWTAVGGDTLLIEVNSMKGTGKLELTGQMGDVMQESARIAMSCARSIADADYGMDDEAFEKLDFHIHIPDGAVKKDGPSAGITMTVALLSVMTGMKVLPQIAMTGEITLKGRVLPVGGLKEKLLAANVAGIRTVLVPSENRPDIEELDDEIIGRMKIEYVDDIRQAVRLVLR